ncbi:MAG: hypothetical protein O3C21_16665 [Verrucomicrobia bacterium]|nr:hypothetical protein [Verrucomicrobiota bacterium]
MNLLDRAHKYVAAIPGAEAGTRGHDQAFKAACALIKNFGGDLSEEQLLEVFREWNATCSPPWNERELIHKLHDAVRQVTPEKPQQKVAAVTKRQSWPDMRPGTEGELQRLSELRGFTRAGLDKASALGFLTFGRWCDRAAWFVTDPAADACQARRLDGQPWPEIRGCKSWTITRREGAARRALGLSDLGDKLPVLIEGGPDFIAAFCLMEMEGADDFAPLAVLGAAIWLDEFTVDALAGRPVVIFTDRDEAGRKGFRKWGGQLWKAGCRQVVDGWKMPTVRHCTGDLNDFLKGGSR